MDVHISTAQNKNQNEVKNKTSVALVCISETQQKN